MALWKRSHIFSHIVEQEHRPIFRSCFLPAEHIGDSKELALRVRGLVASIHRAAESFSSRKLGRVARLEDRDFDTRHIVRVLQVKSAIKSHHRPLDSPSREMYKVLRRSDVSEGEPV